MQAKELQLQLDQIAIKEESPYSLKESGSGGGRHKSKSSKSKAAAAARRSPYPNVTAPADYATTPPDYSSSATSPGGVAGERSTAAAAYYDATSSEMALQMQGYSGIMYPHGTAAQDGVDRYNAFYSSAYGHPGFYSDSTMGMYSSYHRYFDERNAYATRGAYEERYYTKDSGTVGYPGYVSQAVALAAGEAALRPGESCSSRGEASYTRGAAGSDAPGSGGSGSGGSGGATSTLGTSSGGTTGGTTTTSSSNTQYDCSLQNTSSTSASQCSRSSSRDTNYNHTHSHAQPPHPAAHQATPTTPVYPTPFSNRSESSASDVDVTEEYEKRQHAAHHAVLSHRNHDRCSATAVATSYTDNLLEAARIAEDKRYKENCRETTQSTVSLSNGDSKEQQQQQQQQHPQQQSVIMRRQSSTSTALQQDLTSRSHDQVTTPLSKLTSDSTDPAPPRSKSLMDSGRMNLASPYSHCNYDAYKQNSYHSSLQSARAYPMMPQAGYTSVIVDATQQYPFANGYAH